MAFLRADYDSELPTLNSPIIMSSQYKRKTPQIHAGFFFSKAQAKQTVLKNILSLYRVGGFVLTIGPYVTCNLFGRI